jgi:hypothetical protein
LDIWTTGRTLVHMHSRVSNRPFPSFALVMASALSKLDVLSYSQLRLPANHISHLLRFHPYPQSSRRHGLELSREDKVGSGLSHGAFTSLMTCILQQSIDAHGSSFVGAHCVYQVGGENMDMCRARN